MLSEKSKVYIVKISALPASNVNQDLIIWKEVMDKWICDHRRSELIFHIMARLVINQYSL